MVTLPSNGSSVSSLTSTTSSAITISEISVGAAIAICVLIFSLAAYYVISQDDSRNANTSAALQVIWMPLIATFCAWLAFEVTLFWL